MRREAGFTLIEAVAAIAILIVGLMAITNLMLLAGSSNAAGNQGTAAAAEASEVMERLKSLRFVDISPGGSMTSDAGSLPNCNGDTTDCVVPGNFNERQGGGVPGGISLVTRWVVTSVDPQTLFIRVRSESDNPLTASRTRAEFTTIRTCTDQEAGCP